MSITDLSRTIIDYAVMTLDFCTLTFGTGACTATGTKCYNTWATCKDKANYSKGTQDYEFVSCACPLPWGTGERPYITRVDMDPTEIKDNLTVSSRVKIDLADEPDTDIGIDPYVADRSSVQGTFWKKLLARNPNYKGRTVKLYQGVLGDTKGSFVQKFVGKIENIEARPGGVRLDIADLLQDMKQIEVPPKLDIKLSADVTDVATQLTVTDATDLDSTGYVRISDEIIYYGAKNDTTGILSSLTRGSFDTTAVAHSAKDKVQKVRYYAAANPFDILLEMLEDDAGYDSGYIDSAAFTDCKGWPGGEINFRAVVSEPTKLRDLYFEIVDLVDCKSWVGEDLKITIAKNIPNRGARSYAELTDEANIVHNSGSVDLNEESRVTRVVVYWDKNVIGKADDATEYSRIDIGIDADAEGVNEYNEVAEKKLYCRWIDSSCGTEEALADWMEAMTLRYVRQRRDAAHLVQIDVEMKDHAILTGDWLKISTDELQDIDGNDLAAVKFQVVKREVRDNLIRVICQRLPSRPVGIIAPDSITNDFDNATAAEKEYGFIAQDTGRMSDETPAYVVY